MASAIDPRSPFVGTLLLDRHAREAMAPASETLAFWRSRTAGSAFSDDRYRWEVAPARLPNAPWHRSPREWATWRPKDGQLLEREGQAFASRLVLPVAIADNLQLLCSLGEDARDVREETENVARTDYAQFVRGAHAFKELFALYALTRRPDALAAMEPFALAITACHLPQVRRDGFIRGSRFPFHERPLVSASAMLASALLTLGSDLDRAAALVEFVDSEQREEGFGDDDGPADLLTTWLATELLMGIDPAFDAPRAATWLARWQREDGSFAALNPEAPWMTSVVARTLRRAALGFDARFEFPHVADHRRDHKTGLPHYGYFAGLTELFAALPGLRDAPVPVAFLDLTGFREFNNQFGQDLGDAVLAEIANTLAEIEDAVVVRDGGDEFLVVGAPTSDRLGASIETFRARWPERFRTRFGDEAPVVSARVLVGRCAGRRLRQGREILGRAVGELKHEEKSLGRVGLMRDLGAL